MGDPPAYDPIAEAEYLVESDLHAAELDDTLKHVASTYDPERERVVIGTAQDGPRVVNFAPLLELDEFSFNDAVRRLLIACEEAVGSAVEIEFASTLPGNGEAGARLALLQVRPMVVPEESVSITDEELNAANVLLASERVMGNGTDRTIHDIVFVRPDRFEARHTRRIAAELERLNRGLMDAERPYLLIGYGRWGSSDPWLGIPVQWADICGARAIVEATLPEMNVDPSQGSHFFHNITSFGVSYFSVHHERRPNIDWDWLNAQPVVAETEHACHVLCGSPLAVKVDGRTGRGGVWHD
jgi:hypothetical protein